MEMLINVQTGKIGTIKERLEDAVVLVIDGVEKTYKNSTIRRWWKKYQQPVVEEVAEVAESTEIELPETATETARLLVAQALNKGCTIKVTKSYIGVKFGKKTVMEIHCTKKGATKVVVNAKSLDEETIERYTENGYAKKVPDSYGWTLNFTVKVDELTTSSTLELLDKGVEYRR